MGRPDGRIEKGQSLKTAISARAWNRAQDAADVVLGVGTGVTGGALSFDQGPYTWVYAYNSSQAEDVPNVERGDVVNFSSFNQLIEPPVLSMTSTSGTFFARPVVEVLLAGYYGDANLLGVALEPLPRRVAPEYKDTIGRVAVTGIIHAKVKKTAAGGRFAALDPDKQGGLCTSWWKGYRIISMSPGNVGETLAAIIDISTYHVEQVVYGTTVASVAYPLPPELDGNPVVDLNRPKRFGGQATTVRVPVGNAFASVGPNVQVVLHQTLSDSPRSAFTIISSEFVQEVATNGNTPVYFQKPKT